MADERKNPTAEALENKADVAEMTSPESVVDAGENSVINGGDDAKARQNDDGNSNPGETREDQAKRLHKEKQASFEYAENYRQKLKKEAEERPMTPAQKRKKAEKEAAIAREKEEKERALKEAIEKEKEEARQRAEAAANLLDQVEKSLADKKAQEEAKNEALADETAADESMTEEAPVDEAIADESMTEEAPADEAVADESETEEAPADEAVADESMAEEAPVEEAVADEPETEEAPADEAVADESVAEEAPAEDEPIDMMLSIDPDNLDGDDEKPENDMVLSIDPDNLDGDDEKPENEMAFTYNYEEPSEEEPEEKDDSMILTYEVDNITYGEIPEDEKPAPAPMPEAPAPQPEMPMPEPMQFTMPTPEAEPAAPKAKPKKKKKPKKARRTPKKARAIPKKPVAKKPVAAKPAVAKKPEEQKAEAKDRLIAPIVNINNDNIDDAIAKLLEENKELLRENIDELRRRKSEPDKGVSLATDETPALSEEKADSYTPEKESALMAAKEPAAVEAVEVPDEYTAETVDVEDISVEDLAPVSNGDEAIVSESAMPVTEADAPVTEAVDEAEKSLSHGSGIVNEELPSFFSYGEGERIIEEVPDSEHIVNYIPRGERHEAPAVVDGDNYTYIQNTYTDDDKKVLGMPVGEAAGLGALGAFSALAGLGSSALNKKIRDNDKVVRNLNKKLAEAEKKYKYAKTKEEKLDSLTECAEYQRSILEFDSESLAATKMLGKNTDARKRSLQRDVNKYNGFAKKLEKISLNKIKRASATLADDVLAGREIEKLPQILEKDMYEDDKKDDAKSPLSYVSQLDNDDDNVLGGGQSAGKKGKKFKLSKSELRKSKRELRQKLRENNRLLRENRGDYNDRMRYADATEYNDKTEHLAAALNHQREVIAVLGDSYEAAVRTNDPATAKRISSQIDKEIKKYNDLAKTLSKRSGQTLPLAYNSYAKDIAEGRKTKLPPYVQYGDSIAEGTFTDSDDVTRLEKGVVTENAGSEKIVQLGQETRTAVPQEETVTTLVDANGISVIPAGMDGQVVVIGEPGAPTNAQVIQTSGAYQITETAQGEAQAQPNMICIPLSLLQQNGILMPNNATVEQTSFITAPEEVRPLSERIVESAEAAKVIPARPVVEISEDVMSIEGAASDELLAPKTDAVKGETVRPMSSRVHEESQKASAKATEVEPVVEKADDAGVVEKTTVLTVMDRDYVDNIDPEKITYGTIVSHADEKAEAPKADAVAEEVAEPVAKKAEAVAEEVAKVEEAPVTEKAAETAKEAHEDTIEATEYAAGATEKAEEAVYEDVVHTDNVISESDAKALEESTSAGKADETSRPLSQRIVEFAGSALVIPAKGENIPRAAGVGADVAILGVAGDKAESAEAAEKTAEAVEAKESVAREAVSEKAEPVAKKAEAVTEQAAKVEESPVAEKAETAESEAKKTAVEKAKEEAELARAEADKARAEADKAIAEADKAIAEAEKRLGRRLRGSESENTEPTYDYYESDGESSVSVIDDEGYEKALAKASGAKAYKIYESAITPAADRVEAKAEETVADAVSAADNIADTTDDLAGLDEDAKRALRIARMAGIRPNTPFIFEDFDSRKVINKKDSDNDTAVEKADTVVAVVGDIDTVKSAVAEPAKVEDAALTVEEPVVEKVEAPKAEEVAAPVVESVEAKRVESAPVAEKAEAPVDKRAEKKAAKEEKAAAKKAAKEEARKAEAEAKRAKAEAKKAAKKEAKKAEAEARKAESAAKKAEAAAKKAEKAAKKSAEKAENNNVDVNSTIVAIPLIDRIREDSAASKVVSGIKKVAGAVADKVDDILTPDVKVAAPAINENVNQTADGDRYYNLIKNDLDEIKRELAEVKKANAHTAAAENDTVADNKVVEAAKAEEKAEAEEVVKSRMVDFSDEEEANDVVDTTEAAKAKEIQETKPAEAVAEKSESVEEFKVEDTVAPADEKVAVVEETAEAAKAEAPVDKRAAKKAAKAEKAAAKKAAKEEARKAEAEAKKAAKEEARKAEAEAKKAAKVEETVKQVEETAPVTENAATENAEIKSAQLTEAVAEKVVDKSEATQTSADVEKAKYDAEKAKHEAEKAKYEAEKAKYDLDKAKLTSDGARAVQSGDDRIDIEPAGTEFAAPAKTEDVQDEYVAPVSEPVAKKVEETADEVVDSKPVVDKKAAKEEAKKAREEKSAAKKAKVEAKKAAKEEAKKAKAEARKAAKTEKAEEPVVTNTEATKPIEKVEDVKIARADEKTYEAAAVEAKVAEPSVAKADEKAYEAKTVEAKVEEAQVASAEKKIYKAGEPVEGKISEVVIASADSKVLETSARIKGKIIETQVARANEKTYEEVPAVEAKLDETQIANAEKKTYEAEAVEAKVAEPSVAKADEKACEAKTVEAKVEEAQVASAEKKIYKAGEPVEGKISEVVIASADSKVLETSARIKGKIIETQVARANEKTYEEVPAVEAKLDETQIANAEKKTYEAKTVEAKLAETQVAHTDEKVIAPEKTVEITALETEKTREPAVEKEVVVEKVDTTRIEEIVTAKVDKLAERVEELVNARLDKIAADNAEIAKASRVVDNSVAFVIDEKDYESSVDNIPENAGVSSDYAPAVVPGTQKSDLGNKTEAEAVVASKENDVEPAEKAPEAAAPVKKDIRSALIDARKDGTRPNTPIIFEDLDSAKIIPGTKSVAAASVEAVVVPVVTGDVADAVRSEKIDSSEIDKARLEVDRARAEADKARAEADRARSEADKAIAEADKAKTEADRAKFEIENGRYAKAEPAVKETPVAEETKTEPVAAPVAEAAEEVKTEAPVEEKAAPEKADGEKAVRRRIVYEEYADGETNVSGDEGIECEEDVYILIPKSGSDRSEPVKSVSNAAADNVIRAEDATGADVYDDGDYISDGNSVVTVFDDEPINEILADNSAKDEAKPVVEDVTNNNYNNVENTEKAEEAKVDYYAHMPRIIEDHDIAKVIKANLPEILDVEETLEREKASVTLANVKIARADLKNVELSPEAVKLAEICVAHADELKNLETEAVNAKINEVKIAHAESKVLDTFAPFQGKIIETQVARADAKVFEAPAVEAKVAETNIVKADAKVFEAPAVEAKLEEVNVAHAESKVLDTFAPFQGKIIETQVARADAKVFEAPAVEAKVAEVNVAHAESKVLDTFAPFQGKIIETQVARADAKVFEAPVVEAKVAETNIAKADAKVYEALTVEGRVAETNIAKADAKVFEAPTVEGRVAETNIAKADAKVYEALTVEGRVAETNIAKADAKTYEVGAPIEGQLAEVNVAHAESKVLDTFAPFQGKIIETQVARADAKVFEAPVVEAKVAETNIAKADAKVYEAPAFEGRVAETNIAKADAKVYEAVAPIEGKIAETSVAHADEKTYEVGAPIEGQLAEVNVAHAESKILDTFAPFQGKIIETQVARADAKVFEAPVVEAKVAETNIVKADAKVFEAPAFEGRVAETNIAKADAKVYEAVAPVEGKIAETSVAHADEKTYEVGAPIEGQLAEVNVAHAESKVLDTFAPFQGKIIETQVARADAKVFEAPAVEAKVAETNIAKADAKTYEAVAPVEGQLAETSVAKANEVTYREVETVVGQIAKAHIAHADEKLYNESTSVEGQLAEVHIAHADRMEVSDAKVDEAVIAQAPRQVVEHFDDYKVIPAYEVPADMAETAEPEVEEPKVEEPKVEEPKVEENAAPKYVIVEEKREQKVEEPVEETAEEAVEEVTVEDIQVAPVEETAEAPVAEEAVEAPVAKREVVVDEAAAKVLAGREEAPKAEPEVNEEPVERMSINDPIKYEAPVSENVTAKEEAPKAKAEGEATRVPVTVVNTKSKGVSEDLRFYVDATRSGNTVRINDFVASSTNGKVSDSAVAVIDLSKHKGVNNVTVPVQELKDVLMVPGKLNLQFKLNDGSITFDDETIKSIVNKSAGEDINIGFESGMINKAFPRSLKKALKKNKLWGIAEFRCNINDSVTDFGSGKATISMLLPVELAADEALEVRYSADEKTLTTEVFEDVSLADGMFTCKVGHFSYFVIAKKKAVAREEAKPVVAEETPVIAPEVKREVVVDEAAAKVLAGKAPESVAEEVVEAPVAEVAEAKAPEVKAEEAPEFATLTSDYKDTESDKTEHAEVGDTIVIAEEKTEEAVEEAPVVEATEAPAPEVKREVVVDETATKTIAGRTGEAPKAKVAYTITEDLESRKVFAATKVEEAPVVEEKSEKIEEVLHSGDEIVTVVEEKPVVEAAPVAKREVKIDTTATKIIAGRKIEEAIAEVEAPAANVEEAPVEEAKAEETPAAPVKVVEPGEVEYFEKEVSEHEEVTIEVPVSEAPVKEEPVTEEKVEAPVAAETEAPAPEVKRELKVDYSAAKIIAGRKIEVVAKAETPAEVIETAEAAPTITEAEVPEAKAEAAEYVTLTSDYKAAESDKSDRPAVGDTIVIAAEKIEEAVEEATVAEAPAPEVKREVVVDETATKTVAGRVVEAPKAKGAYTITEDLESRKVFAATKVEEAPVVEEKAPEVLHSGEETVSVVEEKAPEATPEIKREVVVDESATKVLAATKVEAPVEEKAEETVSEPVAEIPAETAEKTTKHYILSVDTENTRKIAGSGNGVSYIITEHSDSAIKVPGKVVEATVQEAPVENVPVENHEVVVDTDATKVIASVPAENREVVVDTDATKVLASVPVENREVVVDTDATKVLASVPVENREVVVDADATKVLASVPVENREVVVDADATKVLTSKPAEKRTIVIDESATKVVAGRAVEAAESKGGYIITEQQRAVEAKPATEPVKDERIVVVEQNVAAIPVIEDAPKATSSYTITEQPDSAKRFEAAPAKDVKKGGYSLTIDPAQAKKIEGKPEIKYTITTEDGHKVIAAAPAKEEIARTAYKVGELADEAKVIEARIVNEAPETVEEVAEIFDSVVEVEDIAPVVAEPVAEEAVETAEEAPVEAAIAKRELVVDEAATKVFAAKEVVPEVKREVVVDTTATKTVAGRVIEAPKAKGAYTITEDLESRKVFEAVAKAPETVEAPKAQDETLHVGEEIVTVIDDEPVVEAAPVAKRELRIDTDATKVIAAKEVAPEVKRELVVDTDATKVFASAPVEARELVVDEAATKIFAAKEVAPEVKREVVVDETATKTVAGRVIEAPKAKGAYTITEDLESRKVFEAVAKAPETVEAPKAQDETLHVGEEIVTVIDDEPVVEAAPVAKRELRIDTDATKVIAAKEAAPEVKRELVVDTDATKVFASAPVEARELVVNEAATKIFAAKEVAPEVKREVVVDETATKTVAGRVIDAPKAKGSYKIHEEIREPEFKASSNNIAEVMLTEKDGNVAIDDDIMVITPAAPVKVADKVEEEVVRYAVLTSDAEPTKAEESLEKTYEVMGTITVSAPEVKREVRVDTTATKVIAAKEAATETPAVKRELMVDATAAKVLAGKEIVPEIQREVVVDTTATKTITARTIEAPKAKGAYTITEDLGSRKVFEAVAKAPEAVEAPKVQDEILHVGEEIVTVIDDEPVVEAAPVAKRELRIDADATKVLAGKEVVPAVKREVVVDETATKTVTARILETPKAKGAYTITENLESTKVFEAVAKAPEAVEETKVQDEVLHIGEEVVIVIGDEPVVEAPAKRELVIDTDATRIISGKAEATKKTASIIVEEAVKIAAEPKEEANVYTGYILTEDSNKTKVISARAKAETEAPVVEMKVENLSNAINAPVYAGAEVVTVVEDAVIEAPVAEPEVQKAKTVAEREGSAKILEATKAPEAPKSRDSYIIVEKADSAKVIAARVTAEAEENDVNAINEVNVDVAEPVSQTESITVIAPETTPAEKATEEEAKPVEKTITVDESSTKKIGRGGYVIVESDDVKIIPGTAKEDSTVNNYSIGISDETAVIEGRPTYQLGTDEDNIKIIKAIETLKQAKYDVTEIENRRKTIPAAKVLNVSESDKYVITETRDSAKVITFESQVEEEVVTVVEDVAPVSEVVEEAAPVVKVANAPKSSDAYVILENHGDKKIISSNVQEEAEAEVEATEAVCEAPSEETVLETPASNGYFITEKHGEAKIINRGSEEISEIEEEIAPVVAREAHADGIYIPSGTKILKAKDNYILAESRSEGKIGEKVEPIALVGGRDNASGKFFINEKAGSERTILRAVHDDDYTAGPVVYENAGSAKKIPEARNSSTYETGPVVYENAGTERIIGRETINYAPEGPLVYEEIGTERIVKVSPNPMFEEIDDSVVLEFKDTENVIHGKLPVIDVYANPYTDKDIEILSSEGLKKFIAKTNKEIAKLKNELKKAEKRKNECQKTSEKVVHHIDMINAQCLICEKYVVRVVAATKINNVTLAKRNAQVLSDEIKTYNKYITEYNSMTQFSKVPLADKSIVKRVLAGEAYEHFKRISYHTINDKAALKTKKKGKNAIKAKIIQEDRYIADIKLLERRDNETLNDLTMIENRYNFESNLLKSEKDLMAIKFAKNSIQNDKRKAYIKRKLKKLKAQQAKAIKFENMDNARYYKVFTTDTNFASYSENTAKKKRVNSIIAEVGELLKKRDEINSKLNAVYSGTLGDIAGVNDGDKWRDVKLASAKRHAKKLRSKAHMLKNSVPGFGEEKARKIFAFNSLLDAKVEALATIDLCKYRLRKERNALAEILQIKKDMREAKRRNKLIDKEIRERRKIILDEFYGPDEGSVLVTLFALIALAISGGLAVLQYLGYDVIGTITSLYNTASPILTKVYNMILEFIQPYLQ